MAAARRRKTSEPAPQPVLTDKAIADAMVNGTIKLDADPPAPTTDAIELRAVADLVPYARNARTHSDEQIEQIAVSLHTFRWTNPVLVDEQDGIGAGHGRVLAAARLYERGETIKTVGGLDLPPGTVPVIVARGWTDAEKRAYVLADNKLALNAGWDEAILKIELGDLGEMNFDVAVIGFSTVEIGDIFKDPPAPPESPDQFPEFGEDIETEHACPKCGYKWSGKAS